MVRGLIVLFLAVPLHVWAADICFFGDVLLSRGIDEQMHAEGAAAVQRCFTPYLADDAIHVANLEGAVGRQSPGLRKKDLRFRIRPGYMSVLDGFDLIGLENNHALDLGLTGRKETEAALMGMGIHPLSGVNNSIAMETDKGNIAVMALTDVVNDAGSRRFLRMAGDPRALREIRSLKGRSTLVAVYVHWGRELDDLPTPRMRRLARSFIESGADVVVGTHPHVTGNVEIVLGKPVIYSLGNFLFDQKYRETKKGAVLHCTIDAGNRLRCRLSGVQTPMHSFLPGPAAGEVFVHENETLEGCSPRLCPTWTGRFSASRREKRIRIRTVRDNPGLSYLERSDLQTGKQELRSPSMPVRKLQPVDIDGDGILEIMLVLGVYSTFDREVANRVYVYSMHPGFHALWRGTALSRPLQDAVFVQGKRKKPLLVALHSTDTYLKKDPGKNGNILMCYQWNGFGFSGTNETRTAPLGNHVEYRRNRIMLVDAKGRITSEIPVSDLD